MQNLKGNVFGKYVYSNTAVFSVLLIIQVNPFAFKMTAMFSLAEDVAEAC
jgi:hypothetical protein